jgi:hypothetical protein
MDEELKSFLCKGVWGFDPSESYLIFKEDNTGKVCTSLYHISFDDIKYSEQLVVSSGLCKLICSEFKWKSTIITPLDLTNASNDNKAPRLIGQLNLEITLTGDLPPESRKSHGQSKLVNRGCLTDDAFRPKSFTINIEDGSFTTPISRHSQPSRIDKHPYTKRLLFDTSPLPLESEWKNSGAKALFDPDGVQYWDYREFVGYYSN